MGRSWTVYGAGAAPFKQCMVSPTVFLPDQDGKTCGEEHVSYFALLVLSRHARRIYNMALCPS